MNLGLNIIGWLLFAWTKRSEADLLRRILAVADGNDVVVTEVDPASPAAQKDVKPGDVIVEVTQKIGRAHV